MTDDSRVEELLAEMLESGGTPEEVCRGCPELVEPVRAGWQELRALETEVNGLFPESGPVSLIPHPSEVEGATTTDDPRLQQLLNDLFESDATPEDVCRSCPELLPEVRARWREICRVRSELDAMFPAPGPGAGSPTLSPEDTALPPIPFYEMRRVLGSGGVGVVYEARHLRLNRTVALKMLLAGPYALPEERERFQREAAAVAGLQHPNVVQVYDSGEFDKRPYFTMELIEGGTLAGKLAGTPLPARDAAALVATLADAVRAAHAAGIVHRDLKPGNILLAPNSNIETRNPKQIPNPKEANPKPEPATREISDFEFRISDFTTKIADFGLARRMDGEAGLTRTGAPMGTPSYMAPEQARGDKNAVGPAVDVYALGAILYECLTGRPPFRGETASATIQQVLADDPVPPARLNRQVPRDLETICMKCLEKDPARRYPSAAALADDLRRFTDGESIAARPAGWPERAAKWARRRPTTAALLAAGILMFAGVTAAAGWYASDRAQRGRQINHEANAALEQAEIHLKDLRDQLDHPPQVWELLSDVDRWGRLVDNARQDLERAESPAAGNEVLLTEATQARIEAVEAAVAREEAAYAVAKELDNIAVEALASSDTRGTLQRKAVAEYERLFSRQGLDVHQPGTVWFASAIRSSPVRFALTAALDNWTWHAGVNIAHERARLLARQGVLDNKASLAGLTKDPQLARLLELARAADPDPWRDRFRDPAVWADRAALTRLANEVDVGRQSPTVLASLAWWLSLNGADPTALYEEALLDHPRDFWLHLNAAMFLSEDRSNVGLALAALAIRPWNAIAYVELARSLQERGDWPAALVAAKRAIAINPNYTTAYIRLGLALRHKNDLPGAVTAFQRAIELDPGVFVARHSLGQTLQQQGRYAEAEQAYLGAIKVLPASAPANDALARLLATCPDGKVRDGKRAVEYATTACERSGWKDPLYVDTLAAAHAEAGRFEEAVRYQTRALDDPKLKGDLRPAAKERLELYRQKKPFREKGP